MPSIILISRPLARDNKEFHVSRRKWPPLNLLSIGTYLKQQKLTVEIIDCRAEDYTSSDVKEILLNRKPRLVLIASDPFDFYQCPNPSMTTFYDCISLAHQAGAKYILSIGPQATLFDKELLEKTALTHLIKGDDPLTAAKLIQDLLNNKDINYYNNVSYKTNNNLHLGLIQHLENLDDLPIGDYSLLPMKKYTANIRAFPIGNFTIMSTSRGCPYQCKYCFKELIGHKIRQMSLARIKKELDVLVNQYKIETIYFIDDLFTFNYARTCALGDIIKKYNLKWGCQTRTDNVNFDLLKSMQEAGCVYISYGVESGSQRIIDQANKNLKLDLVREVIKTTRRLGIYAHLNMMYGFPGETKKDFRQSINFMLKNKEYELPGAIRFYPGCQFYRELIPHKTVEEAEKISSDFSLSKLKRADIDRSLAKLILAKKIRYKEFNLSFIYFLLKYLFPNIMTFFRRKLTNFKQF